MFCFFCYYAVIWRQFPNPSARRMAQLKRWWCMANVVLWNFFSLLNWIRKLDGLMMIDRRSQHTKYRILIVAWRQWWQQGKMTSCEACKERSSGSLSKWRDRRKHISIAYMTSYCTYILEYNRGIEEGLWIFNCLLAKSYTAVGWHCVWLWSWPYSHNPFRCTDNL